MNNISKTDLDLLKQKYDNLDPIIDKINNNYPIQYLIGYVDFYGYQIKVNESVLIPRFETETLVEKTVNYIKERKLLNAKVIDIGTGSGCICIALKKIIESLSVSALDISSDALKLAKENAKLNKVNINFILSDIFKFDTSEKYDVIISNPPYIPTGSICDPKIEYEPYNAIYVSGNPLKYYEQIFKLAKKIINPQYLMAFEIDEDESVNLYKLAHDFFPNEQIIIEKDLANKDRFLFIMND